jgi:hypothetical protein
VRIETESEYTSLGLTRPLEKAAGDWAEVMRAPFSARGADVSGAGESLEVESTAIRNPVSGAEVHPGAILPEGIVFKRGDFGASTTFRVSDGISFEHAGQYTAVAPFDYSGP